jgi:hypothetical protein
LKQKYAALHLLQKNKKIKMVIFVFAPNEMPLRRIWGSKTND